MVYFCFIDNFYAAYIQWFIFNVVVILILSPFEQESEEAA